MITDYWLCSLGCHLMDLVRMDTLGKFSTIVCMQGRQLLWMSVSGIKRLHKELRKCAPEGKILSFWGRSLSRREAKIFLMELLPLQVYPFPLIGLLFGLLPQKRSLCHVQPDKLSSEFCSELSMFEVQEFFYPENIPA